MLGKFSYHMMNQHNFTRMTNYSLSLSFCSIISLTPVCTFPLWCFVALLYFYRLSFSPLRPLLLLSSLLFFTPYMTFLISCQSYISTTRRLFSLSNPFLSPMSALEHVWISSPIYVVNKNTTRFSFTRQACGFYYWKLRIPRITSDVHRIASCHQQSFPF